MGDKRTTPRLRAINGSRPRTKGRDNEVASLADHINEEKIEPPKHLKRLEKIYFNELSEKLKSLGILSSVFMHIQTLCAEEMAQRQLYQKDIKKNKATYTTKNSQGESIIKVNPSVMLAEKSSNRIKSLLSEMGLSHTSVTRSGARAPHSTSRGGKFDGF